MKNVSTKYGALNSVSSHDIYENGEVKECLLDGFNEISTNYGTLIPQYQDGDVRRKYTPSVSFYKDGNLKSISLHQQTSIDTSWGMLPAELITFYESGNIKRVFPLNGKISSYWTEENEYELAEEFEFNFKFGSFRKKIMAFQFYEKGKIKSLTFWPEEYVSILSPAGELEVRIGISLYPDGSLKSVEPNKPAAVKTPIGDLAAFNSDAVGIHGELNSLNFYEDGSIKSLVSSTDIIRVTDKTGKEKLYGPGLRQNLLDVGKMDIVPLCIEFFDNKVRIGGGDENIYEIDNCIFAVKSSPKLLNRKCNECSGCSGCG